MDKNARKLGKRNYKSRGEQNSSSIHKRSITDSRTEITNDGIFEVNTNKDSKRTVNNREGKRNNGNITDNQELAQGVHHCKNR